MTELLRPQADDRALEIGTGSGYQAAILSRLVSHVYTIEIVEPLARDAERRLTTLGYSNVTVRVGDGYAGWPEAAPFDVIVVTAAPDHVPSPLVAQLKPGGRLVIPVGPVFTVQELRLIEKDAAGEIHTRTVAPVAFGQPAELAYRLVAEWPKQAKSAAGTSAGPWNFIQVPGMAVPAAAGRVIVLHRGAHPVLEFDSDGNFVRSWGDGLFSFGKVVAIATGCEPGGLVAEAVSGKAAKLLGTDPVDVRGEKKK